MTQLNIEAYNQTDNRFLTGDVALVAAAHPGLSLSYATTSRPQWQEPWTDTVFPPEVILESPDMACFLAFDDEEPVGQIVVLAGPFHTVQIWDIRVAPRLRRQKIATALLQYATDWARQCGFEGMAADVPSVNAGYCRFLTASGYSLGGVDYLRYRPLERLLPRSLRSAMLTFYYYFR